MKLNKVIALTLTALFTMSGLQAQSLSPSTKTHWDKGTLVVESPARAEGQTHVLNLTAPKMKTVRVAFVGLGMRGPGAVARFTHIPGVEVVALCEREQDNTNYKRLQKLLKENTRKQENVASAIVECDNEGVRKLMYEQVAKIQTERAELEKQLALEKASQVHLSVSDIKFFLKQLKKGKADDIRYRKTLINVFINAIYLYDDKITFIFNSGDKPITIDDKLLSDIEADNKAFECSILEQVAPP